MSEEKKNEQGQTLREFIDAYDESEYRHPSMTVDMLLMTVADAKLKVLLIRRRNHPWIGQWALPGGFVEYDEDLEKAVRRELKEETHITRYTYFRQMYTFGKVDRDPRTRVISTVYLSMTPEDNIRAARAGDDAAETAWFDLSKIVKKSGGSKRVSELKLVNEEHGMQMIYEITDTAHHNYVATRSRLLKTSNAQLAGDHIKAVNMGMDKVQHRAASTGILFNLLPEEATLREMQTAYEAVIGHQTDTGNFRRDIQKMLKKTGHTRIVHGKKAELYRFNPLFSFVEENL